MAERWRHTWSDLVAQVVSPGRCTGCSGCIVACPKDVLTLDRGSWTPELDSSAWAENDAARCIFGERGCTLCTRSCPRFGSWETEADMELWGRTRIPEEVIGVHRRLLLVQATDRAIAEAGQDGGLGTAMLQYALANDFIDAALVSDFDTEQRTRPGLATTPEEFLAAAGSRYTYSPNLLAVDGAERGMRLGLVGVGCQTSVPVIARTRGNKKLAKRFGLVIGLLCSKTFSDNIYEDLLEATYGVPRRTITKVNIKGKLQIWHDSESDGPSYLEVPLKEAGEYTRPGCLRCPDFAAQHADVSLGGIGKYPGRTLTISRTDLSEEILTAMEADGLITLDDAVTEDPDAVALINKLARLQRRRWAGEGGDEWTPDLAPAAVKSEG